jgi:N-acetylmuramoyl-L-alanine amidase
VTDQDVIDTLNEPQTLALTLYGEARGEPVEGRIAVASVIRNRIGRYGSNYKAVCLRPRQFSCWNPNDPNYAQLTSAARVFLRGGVMGPDVRECVWIADGMIGEVLRSNIGSCTHYMTMKLWQEAPPSWARGKVPSYRVGRHVFFNAID